MIIYFPPVYHSFPSASRYRKRRPPGRPTSAIFAGNRHQRPPISILTVVFFGARAFRDGPAGVVVADRGEVWRPWRAPAYVEPVVFIRANRPVRTTLRSEHVSPTDSRPRGYACNTVRSRSESYRWPDDASDRR